jgi:hypothetical protein
MIIRRFPDDAALMPSGPNLTGTGTPFVGPADACEEAPMATGTSVQMQALAHSINLVDGVTQQLGVVPNRVQGIVTNTLGGYQSEGATIWGGVMEEWNVHFGKVVHGLAYIRDTMAKNHRDYGGVIEQDRASANTVPASGNTVPASGNTIMSALHHTSHQ